MDRFGLGFGYLGAERAADVTRHVTRDRVDARSAFSFFMLVLSSHSSNKMASSGCTWPTLGIDGLESPLSLSFPQPDRDQVEASTSHILSLSLFSARGTQITDECARGRWTTGTTSIGRLYYLD